MSATEAPERIGPYRLLRPLGEGGMGAVHLGLDTEGREVAVKVLHPHVASDLKARDRLTREVETMRRVRSRRVAEVLDADLTGAMPYIVTRYAPGRTLEQTVLADGPLPDQEIIRLARGLCEALTSIHAADVIHRDLKPANVMLVGGEPLVIDFGIAHLVNATRLTQTGMFVGTPGYLAPEIIRDSEITQAADVHALAATVFFAATGKPPFGTGTFEAVCFRILEGKANVDQAPGWLRAWLRLALATEVGSRPSAGSLLRLTQTLDPSVTALHENAQDGGTRVLGGPGGNGRVPDGTRILDDDVTWPGHPERHGADASDDSYSDLLPPVNYIKQERQAPPGYGTAQPHQPPPYQPAPYQPAAYRPPAGQAPPPHPDQRVAGYPDPRATVPPPGQAAGGASTQARPQAGEQQKTPYKGSHPLVSASLLVALVALTCMLPVTMALVAVALSVCLRVVHYLLGGITERRSVRGSSGADPLIAVVGAPWALIKAALATVVQVPLAAMFGVCVWGGLYYLGNFTTDRSAAYAAAAFVAGLFLLPGGGAPRKAVARTLSSSIRSPGAAMVVTIAVGALAFFAVLTAMSASPVWAPWRPPSEVIKSLQDQGRETVANLVSGLFGDLLDRLGLGFLSFWN
jgi:serine/threonine protein kinase